MIPKFAQDINISELFSDTSCQQDGLMELDIYS